MNSRVAASSSETSILIFLARSIRLVLSFRLDSLPLLVCHAFKSFNQTFPRLSSNLTEGSMCVFPDAKHLIFLLFHGCVIRKCIHLVKGDDKSVLSSHLFTHWKPISVTVD